MCLSFLSSKAKYESTLQERYGQGDVREHDASRDEATVAASGE